MIKVNLDKILNEKKTTLSELAQKTGISIVNLSNIKTGKIKAIRFSTLEAICIALNCHPKEIFEYKENKSC